MEQKTRATANEAKSWSSDKSNETDKPLARLTGRKRKDTDEQPQDERADLDMHPTDSKRIMGCYEPFYANR